ncbi:MAG: PilZ domain-containing protein [Planctomycetota bacterium]|jgi:hypothetical protein
MIKYGSLIADEVHRRNIEWLNNGKIKERRGERRLCYDWPIWFSEGFKKTLFKGQLLDVSSGGTAFTCNSRDDSPYLGQQLTIRFRIPRFGSAAPFNVVLFTRIGHVCRLENIDSQSRRVVVEFARPLFFKPGEQDVSDSNVREKLKAVR